MSQENVETLRRAYEAFNRGDLEAAVADAHPDVEYIGRGKQSGISTTWTMWQVWMLKDGKFVHGQGFTNRDEALAAVGLRE